MKLRKSVNVFVMLTGLLLAACTPQPTMPLPTDTPDAPLPTVVLNATHALSAQTSVPVEEIQVIGYEQREWPDACLGLAQEDEMCAQVITPGWRVVLSAGGEQYVFRTDETGEVIRPENLGAVPSGG